MYICPMCEKEFPKEDIMVKHLLSCWKEKNPNHKSNEAPHSEDVVTRNASDSVFTFFEGINHGN